MSVETPDVPTIKEGRIAQLEALDTVKELAEIAEPLDIHVKGGMSKDSIRALILEKEFPEGKDPEGPSTAPPKKKAPEKSEEEDPLVLQHDDLREECETLYGELVERIKDAKQTEAKGDTADQMRAGAVQFLGQCNETLRSAQQVLLDVKEMNARNNEQLQSINYAKEDLNRRSEEYNRMTSGGKKNAGQE